ncbi:MAG: hypothetical protein J6P03_06385 [Opitutales bacterium]|nr:hypothetical protein [Opitutales bacterium]
MKNLNIIRAKSAFSAAQDTYCGKNGGELAKKLPPRIMNSGLIQALAFASASENENEIKLYEKIKEYLQSKDVAVLDPNDKKRSLLEIMLDSDSRKVALATRETLAWLSFFRRFAKKGGE